MWRERERDILSHTDWTHSNIEELSIYIYISIYKYIHRSVERDDPHTPLGHIDMKLAMCTCVNKYLYIHIQIYIYIYINIYKYV